MKDSKQLTTEQTCSKKQTYWSYETARRSVKRRNKSAGFKYLRSYKCNICGLWHVTKERKIDERQ